MKKLGTITRKASMLMLLCMAVVLCFSLVMLSFGTIAKADNDDTTITEDVTDNESGDEADDNESGDGEQEGDRPAAIELTSANVSFVVNGGVAITFTGNNNYKPSVEVYYKADSESDNIRLNERTIDTSEEGDYIITYGDTRNVNHDGYRFQITGVNKYSGVVGGNFSILPLQITDSDLKLSESKLTYNGEVQQPNITFSYNGTPLVLGLDYNLTSQGAVSGSFQYTFIGTENIGSLRFTGMCDINPATDNSWTMLSIVSWMQGKFNPAVNTINSSVKYGSTTATYSIYKTESNGEISGAPLYNFSVKDGGVIDVSAETVDSINSELEAGNYKLRASVAAKDGLYNAATRDYDFVITSPSYKKPTLAHITEGAGKNDTYTGSPLAMNINNYDVNGMTISFSEGVTLENNTLYALNAGTYTITFTLADAEAYWGTDADDKSPVTLTWTIAKQKVAVPVYGTDTFTYNGKAQTYLPEGFDSKLMTITGNTATEAGDYEAVISLINFDNYQWDSSTYSESRVVVHRYEIKNSNKAFTVTIVILAVIFVLGAAGVVLQYYMHKQRLKIFAMASESVKENNDGGNK